MSPRRALTVAMLSLLMPAIASGARDAVVLGRVADGHDSCALAGALVQLDQRETAYTTLTDSLGCYVLRGQPGRCGIFVSRDSYATVSTSLVLYSGGRYRRDFHLSANPIPMPMVAVETTRAGPMGRRRNDSILAMLRGLTFVYMRPWVVFEGGGWVTDSAAVKFNNEAMLAAAKTLTQRRRGLFRRPANCYLTAAAGDGRVYILISRDRCVLVEDERRVLGGSGVHAYDVDSLKVTYSFFDGSKHMSVPYSDTMSEYLLLDLEAFIRGRGWWRVLSPHSRYL